MKEMHRDILADNPQLRKQAYSVPEGYFEGFKAEMKPYGRRQSATFARLVPYISAAAAFLFLITAGTLFLRGSIASSEFTQEDYLVFSNSMINVEYYEEMQSIADAGIADEDIIEYLIHSGISAEEIELSK
jgi:hypothetical protein